MEDVGRFTVLYRDSSGIIWAGSNGYGLQKYSPSLHRFHTLFPGNSLNNVLLLDTKGNLLTEFNGLRMDADMLSNHMLYPLRDLINKRSRLTVNRNGNLWFATEHVGKGQIQVFRYTGPDQGKWTLVFSTPIAVISSLSMITDDVDRLWLAHAAALLEYTPENQRLKLFKYPNSLPGNLIINSIAQTAGNQIWIGTEDGLIRAKPAADTMTFSLLQNSPGNIQCIQGNHVTQLITDPKDPYLLWIATNGGGLSRLDTRSMRFRHFNTRTGFPDNVIYGVLPDNNGLLWMSSNKGLIRLDPATGAIENFTVKDGLPTDEFNQKAMGKKPDGTLLFGGLKGLVAFNPKDFSNNPVTPRVRITGLEINNRSVSYSDSTGILDQTIEFTKKLTLPYTQNSIGLHFAALEYMIPSKINSGIT
ncbi:MAG: hypothetical protein IPK76_03035 [Lewinellaceae bacterium]|nr:hypothetical protein [Lewinellaceae bacterium]